MAAPAPRRIKPAGWVLIIAAAGGALYWSWLKVAPILESRPEPEQPARVAEPAPVTAPPPSGAPAPPSAPARPEQPAEVLSRSLFPTATQPLPPPGKLPAFVVPALTLLRSPLPEGARLADSEQAAIKLVASGEAKAAVVSVAALAGSPKAIHEGVRAVWYLGPSRADGSLEPGCDSGRLREMNLSVVRLSLAHFQLLSVLAGAPLPPIVEFSTEDELAAASAHRGGEATVPHRSDAACGSLPDRAFSFVVVEQRDHPLDPAELSAVVALRVPPVTDADAVAAFFRVDGQGHSPFSEIFTAASTVWVTTHQIDAAALAADAVDSRFLRAVPPANPPAAKTAEAPAPSPAPELGYPAWVDAPHAILSHD